MQAHRIEAIVEPDGSVKLTALPFRPGERVEIIVLSAPSSAADKNEAPLYGTILHYDRPTDPVAEEDWEVLR
jgi:hypothetical protein